MNQKILNAVYTERKRTYHMLTAITATIETEKNISEKAKNLILDIQKEAEELYLLISHDIHCQYSQKGGNE